MEILLNRWRGTGKIAGPVTGAMIYAVYVGLLFGLVTQTWWIGVLMVGTFLLGESMGWGKWIGSICYPNEVSLEQRYLDKEGYGFPYTHYIANAIVAERENYTGYCQVALGIRGMWWAAIMYAPLLFVGLAWYVYVIAVAMWAVGFPLACWLSTKKEFAYANKIVSVVGRWETQEVYYGVVQMVANLIVVVTLVWFS